ncbi:purple acid phosphatase-like protein [Cryomyces antarcticus]
MQLRLAYTGDTGVRVSWNTFTQLQTPTVRCGTNPQALNQVASSNVSITYPTSLTHNNHATISGLEPDTLYYYQPANSNSSTPYTFRTSRPAGNGDPFTVALVVDLGTMGEDGLTTRVELGAANPLKPGETNTIQSLQDHESMFDFLWHSGDLAYADYWLKGEIQKFLPNTTIANGYKGGKGEGKEEWNDQ